MKNLFRIPSWGLSLLTAVTSLIILIFIVSLFDSILPIDKEYSEAIAYIIYGVLIAMACFYICKNNPKSIWYVPILCNTPGIISSIVEPTFWITSLWILMLIGWILSIIGSIIGARIGKKTL